jgi:hypothetical protein
MADGALEWRLEGWKSALRSVSARRDRINFAEKASKKGPAVTYRVNRIVVLGFLIALPLLARVGSAPAGREGVPGSRTVFWVGIESALAGAVILADGRRRRLLAECARRVDPAARGPVPYRPATAAARQSVAV